MKLIVKEAGFQTVDLLEDVFEALGMLPDSVWTAIAHMDGKILKEVMWCARRKVCLRKIRETPAKRSSDE